MRAAEPLGSYEVELAGSSVSGLSSGAFMAVQFHVAFSSILVGAGIVAGGPYRCAEGSLAKALNRCMKTVLGPPEPERLLEEARALAATGAIDDPANLADDRVYIFAGSNDETVAPRVTATTRDFYALAGLTGDALAFVDDLPAGHALITEDFGRPCAETGSPFLNDCDYDQAGAILEQIYGPLAAPVDPESGGRILAFDQGEFLFDAESHGMSETGYLYLPDSCAEGDTCRVHIVFHGCRQTPDDIGETFVHSAGFNRWAAANDLIVLYPQAHATPENPNGCWDWWGYDDPDYDLKSGRQMAAVRAMLDRLAGITPPPPGFCARYEASNYGHWLAGRAEVCDVWFFCAVGSGENLGFLFSAPTLFEQPEGHFSTRPCDG